MNFYSHIVQPSKEVGPLGATSKLAVFNKSQRKNETRQTVVSLVEPLGNLELVLDNASYERYDTEDIFIADFISKTKKALR